MKGVLPGNDLGKVFTWLRPNDLVWNYWVSNYLMGDSPSAFDILAWNRDNTNLPARLHKDFLRIFEENLVVKPGQFEALGTPIDLGEIKCDNFIVGAMTDHLTPWKACYQACTFLGGDSTFALSNGGHVAALVNPPSNPKAHHFIAPGTKSECEEYEFQPTNGKDGFCRVSYTPIRQNPVSSTAKGIIARREGKTAMENCCGRPLGTACKECIEWRHS
jgi:polyhydroxyalkanoate synthase